MNNMKKWRDFPIIDAEVVNDYEIARSGGDWVSGSLAANEEKDNVEKSCERLHLSNFVPYLYPFVLLFVVFVAHKLWG